MTMADTDVRRRSLPRHVPPDRAVRGALFDAARAFVRVEVYRGHFLAYL
jgi:hypothetical protein